MRDRKLTTLDAEKILTAPESCQRSLDEVLVIK